MTKSKSSSPESNAQKVLKYYRAALQSGQIPDHFPKVGKRLNISKQRVQIILKKEPLLHASVIKAMEKPAKKQATRKLRGRHVFLLKEIQAFVDTDISEMPLIEELCEKYELTDGYVKLLIKKHFGKGFYQEHFKAKKCVAIAIRLAFAKAAEKGLAAPSNEELRALCNAPECKIAQSLRTLRMEGLPIEPYISMASTVREIIRIYLQDSIGLCSNEIARIIWRDECIDEQKIPHRYHSAVGNATRFLKTEENALLLRLREERK